MSRMPVVTFWATVRGRTIPPYVLLGIASMRRVFGEDLVILKPSNLNQYIDFDFQSKVFFFAASADKDQDELSRIVATSDFVRFAFIEKWGGLWLDADTVALKDFRVEIEVPLSKNLLVWQCEALFAARSGNSLVKDIMRNMVEAPRQQFGNPGNSKSLLTERKSELFAMPQHLWDPTGNASYNAKNWEAAVNQDIVNGKFMNNSACAVVKMYNSVFSRFDFSKLSILDFLDSGSPLAAAFLSIESDRTYWESTCTQLRQELSEDHIWPAKHPYA